VRAFLADPDLEALKKSSYHLHKSARARAVEAARRAARRRKRRHRMLIRRRKLFLKLFLSAASRLEIGASANSAMSEIRPRKLT
jgi:hypothetical protein